MVIVRCCYIQVRQVYFVFWIDQGIVGLVEVEFVWILGLEQIRRFMVLLLVNLGECGLVGLCQLLVDYGFCRKI